MTRFVLDPAALMVLTEGGHRVDPAHHLVAPNAIRAQALELRLLGDRVSRRTAWNLAREHGWDSLRDAEYLAVALLQADALIAAGSGLAAKAAGIVPLASLAALQR